MLKNSGNAKFIDLVGRSREIQPGRYVLSCFAAQWRQRSYDGAQSIFAKFNVMHGLCAGSQFGQYFSVEGFYKDEARNLLKVLLPEYSGYGILDLNLITGKIFEADIVIKNPNRPHPVIKAFHHFIPPNTVHASVEQSIAIYQEMLDKKNKSSYVEPSEAGEEVKEEGEQENEKNDGKETHEEKSCEESS